MRDDDSSKRTRTLGDIGVVLGWTWKWLKLE